MRPASHIVGASRAEPGAFIMQPRVLLFPIIIFELYLNFGLLLFFFGPLDYQVRHPVSLPLYLIASHVCLYLGYRRAIRKRPRAYSGFVPVPWLVNFAIVSVFVVALVDYIMLAGSITDIPGAVAAGLQDLTRAYIQKSEVRTLYTGIIRYTILFIIASPLMLPLVVAYWTRLPVMTKVNAVLVKFWELGTWIAIGTTKGIADTFLLIPLLVLCGYPHLIAQQLFARRKILFGIATAAGMMIVIVFFSTAKGTSRFEASQVTGGAVLRYEFYDRLPPSLGSGSAMLVSYMVQGYHGLDLSFSQPFVWALGGGHSPFFLGQFIHDAYGNTAASLSYPARVEISEDWGMMLNWHSIYPWIASDLTFPGTLLFVFGMGYLYGLSWLDWLVKRNPLAFAVFSQLSLILLYFPCNNSQILGNIGVLGFVVWVTMWLFTRVNRVAFDLNRTANIS